MANPTRYEFTNYTEEPFTGRYAGTDYTFAPGETRAFDPDKHYMLKLMAKQLANRELNKRAVSIGRDPKDMETWGKSLDSHGKVFTITADMRLVLMRNAIGNLADTNPPIPEDELQSPEAGSSKETSADVKTLQDEVRELKDMVQSLTAHALKTQPQTQTGRGSDPEVPATEPTSMAPRSALEDMAREAGITNTDRMTKEELIRVVSARQAQI